VLVANEDFSGRATFVAQVDRILEEQDEVLVLRLLKSSPHLPMERQGMLEAVPQFVEAMAELGIPVSKSDFVLTRPTVLLKPICIYK
jgi:hypothetical protein